MVRAHLAAAHPVVEQTNLSVLLLAQLDSLAGRYGAQRGAVSASQMDMLCFVKECTTGMTFGLYHYSMFNPCQQDVVLSRDLSSVSKC